ncbi:MAG TPA: hypothetical protein DGG95_10805 [Cytophagales bacterium]|jgi:hypothetical protein|nr:hypothetical protein [Cytophagales bacterium]
MSIFNETASNYIQFISMVFEVVGITLAYIEIRFKPLADRIETRILNDESRIKAFAYKLIENKLSASLITVFITVIFFVEIPYLVGFYDKVIPESWQNTEATVIWSTSPIIFLFVVLIWSVLMGDFVAWLNRFSNGHAIGALGVVVTMIGLLGDSYQAITILVNK